MRNRHNVEMWIDDATATGMEKNKRRSLKYIFFYLFMNIGRNQVIEGKAARARSPHERDDVARNTQA